MRVLPYFNNIQLPVRRERTAEVKAPQAPAHQETSNTQAPAVSAGETSMGDVFIPSSPVSGVVYSYKSPPAGQSVPESIIKSGDYKFYQINGSAHNRETGTVGRKLDLKG